MRYQPSGGDYYPPRQSSGTRWLQFAVLLVCLAVLVLILFGCQVPPKVKTGAQTLDRAVGAACDAVEAASLFTDEVKHARELCDHRHKYSASDILDAVSACNLEPH